MIVLFNPLSTTPGKQPLPLSLMSLAAVLEGRRALGARRRQRRSSPIRRPRSSRGSAHVPRRARPLLAVTVMPGPQLTQAVDVCRAVRARAAATCRSSGAAIFRRSTPTPCCASPFVDFVVRSQGERPLLQLLDVLRTGGVRSDRVQRRCRGECGCDGRIVHNPTRPDDAARRAAGSAVPPRRHGALHPSDLPRPAHRRAQLVVRLSVRVQLLRGRRDVEPPLAGAVAGAHGARPAASGRRLRRRRRADARHGLLHLRSARRRSSPSASPALGHRVVGARPHRHADAVLATRRGRRWRARG